MKKNFTHYYFLISCPGDIQEDIKIILDVTDEVNRRVGDHNQIYLVPMFWKNDAVPAAGASAQEIINKQLLNKADGVIALFWTKFGTPTDMYGSGTEEEIIKAINDKKDVLLFCCDKPIAPSLVNDAQYAKVVNFKNTYHGLFASYSSEAELKSKLNAALTDLIFKYANDQNNIASILTVEDNKVFPKYTLAEYFELGWFLRRSYLELPSDSESSEKERTLFVSRMNMIISLADSLHLVNGDDLGILTAYRDKIMALGLKGYISFFGKVLFDKVYSILGICEIGLLKKLAKKESASFQFGMHYGQYALIIQVEWLEEHGMAEIYMKELRDSLNEAYSEYEKMKKFSGYIHGKLRESLACIAIDSNLELTASDFNDKVCCLADDIMRELQMY